MRAVIMIAARILGRPEEDDVLDEVDLDFARLEERREHPGGLFVVLPQCLHLVLVYGENSRT